VKNATPDESRVASHLVAEARKALEEARGFPDCAALVALLEARLEPCAELLANAHQRVELLDLAHVARREAIAALHAAEGAPFSLDRSAAIARRDEIDYRSGCVVVREYEVSVATDRRVSPFAGISRVVNAGAGRAAAGVVEAIVRHVLTSTGTPPGCGSHVADEEQSGWESLEAHRAIARVEARAYESLRFADTAGVKKAATAVRVAFDQRVAARVSREVMREAQNARGAASRGAIQRANEEAQRKAPAQPAANGFRSL